MSSITIKIDGLAALQQRMRGLGMLKGIDARVGNNTAYAPYVGSAKFQADVHKGRWSTDEQVIRNLKTTITADFMVAVASGLEAPILRVNPLKVAANAAVLRIQSVMAKYPTGKPGSTYVRTGTYGRRWTTEVREVNPIL